MSEYMEQLEEENAQLRKIVSECAAALGTGWVVSPDEDIVFLEYVPDEIRIAVDEAKWEIRRLTL